MELSTRRMQLCNKHSVKSHRKCRSKPVRFKSTFEHWLNTIQYKKIVPSPPNADRTKKQAESLKQLSPRQAPWVSEVTVRRSGCKPETGRAIIESKMFLHIYLR